MPLPFHAWPPGHGRLPIGQIRHHHGKSLAPASKAFEDVTRLPLLFLGAFLWLWSLSLRNYEPQLSPVYGYRAQWWLRGRLDAPSGAAALRWLDFGRARPRGPHWRPVHFLEFCSCVALPLAISSSRTTRCQLYTNGDDTAWKLHLGCLLLHHSRVLQAQCAVHVRASSGGSLVA